MEILSKCLAKSAVAIPTVDPIYWEPIGENFHLPKQDKDEKEAMWHGKTEGRPEYLISQDKGGKGGKTQARTEGNNTKNQPREGQNIGEKLNLIDWGMGV